MPALFAFISAGFIFARFIFLFCMSHFVNSLSAHIWVQVCEPLKRLTVRSGSTVAPLVLCDGSARDCSARLGSERQPGLDSLQAGRTSCNLDSVVNPFLVFRTSSVERHTKRDLWSTGGYDEVVHHQYSINATHWYLSCLSNWQVEVLCNLCNQY